MKNTLNTALINFSDAAARTLAAPIAAVNAACATLKARMTPAAAPAIAARPAHCGNIMTLLAHLCDMDDELQLWVLRWLAYPLRNPGARMSTALVLNGGQGSGKSLFLNFVVAELYGDVAAKIRPPRPTQRVQRLD